MTWVLMEIAAPRTPWIAWGVLAVWTVLALGLLALLAWWVSLEVRPPPPAEPLPDDAAWVAQVREALERGVGRTMWVCLAILVAGLVLPWLPWQ